MKLLRRIIGQHVKRQNKSDGIMRKYNVDKVSEWPLKRKRQWKSHVSGMAKSTAGKIGKDK